MNYKEKIERLKKSCYGNAPCEIDRERLEAAQIIEELIGDLEQYKKITEKYQYEIVPEYRRLLCKVTEIFEGN